MMIRIPQRRSMLKSSGLVAAIAIFAGAAISPWSIVEASTIYECTDESGKVTFSDRPCGGGKAVELRPCDQESQEQSRDEARRKALQHQEEVAVRLSIDRLEREKDRLESQRRSLIRERDSRAARLNETLAEAHDAAEANFWQKRINETHIASERQIRAIEKAIFDKQLELQQLLTAHDVPHVRATTRVLDRASWGKCSLYIEGEETAMSLRVRGDGFEPGETVEVISRSGDEVIRKIAKISENGCYEGIVLPRVIGRLQGKGSYTLKGTNCRLTVNYRWRMP